MRFPNNKDFQELNFNLGGGFGGFGGAASSGGGFKFSMSSNDAFKNSGKSIFGNTSESGEKENGEQEECTAEFAPVLNELPPEIEVKTGIEDDEEIFSSRGKLYRYARECNPAEWKERGLGDIKILKTKNGRYRVVMRREQVLKVCANHYISSQMALRPQATNDRAWIWSAMDFG